METFKGIMKKFFFLPPFHTVIIALPSFLLVIYALSADTGNEVLSYVAYTVSAYAMCIVSTGCFRIVRLARLGINDHPLVRTIVSHPLGKRFLKDVSFRTEISLYQGVLINLLYVAIKLGSGIYYRSAWFISLAGYYSLLVVMRFFLLRHMNRNTVGQNLISEYRRYRLCGVLLLLMNQALAVIVIFMVYQNKGYEYPGMLIYVMAAYAFYSVSLAVINLMKFRRHGSPVLSAVKVINLTAALVSILSLESAMLAQFGSDDGPAFRQFMTGASGAGVCTIVFGMAVVMIVRSTKQLKQQHPDTHSCGDPL